MYSTDFDGRDNTVSFTVRPLNKEHIGIKSTIPCTKAVLILEVTQATQDGTFLVVLHRGCLHFGGFFMGGPTTTSELYSLWGMN